MATGWSTPRIVGGAGREPLREEAATAPAALGVEPRGSKMPVVAGERDVIGPVNVADGRADAEIASERNAGGVELPRIGAVGANARPRDDEAAVVGRRHRRAAQVADEVNLDRRDLLADRQAG